MEQPVYTFDTAFLALIISVISIFSPVITALIHSHHETKMRKMDDIERKHKEYELHKRDILEKSLFDIGSITQPTIENITKLGNSCLLAIPYVDEETAKTLEEIYLNGRMDFRSINNEQLSKAIAGIRKALSELNKS